MSDFEFLMLANIRGSSSMESAMNEAILSLHKKGYLDITTKDDGKPSITISEAGEGVYTSMLFSSVFQTPIGEA